MVKTSKRCLGMHVGAAAPSPTCSGVGCSAVTVPASFRAVLKLRAQTGLGRQGDRSDGEAHQTNLLSLSLAEIKTLGLIHMKPSIIFTPPFASEGNACLGRWGQSSQTPQSISGCLMSWTGDLTSKRQGLLVRGKLQSSTPHLRHLL